MVGRVRIRGSTGPRVVAAKVLEVLAVVVKTTEYRDRNDSHQASARNRKGIVPRDYGRLWVVLRIGVVVSGEIPLRNHFVGVHFSAVNVGVRIRSIGPCRRIRYRPSDTLKLRHAEQVRVRAE